MRFAGYAAIFDRPDHGGDIIRKGAFTAALRRAQGEKGVNVPLFWQHDPRQPVGTIESLSEDKRGLRVIAQVDEDQAAALVSSGAVKGLSFGYRVRGATRGIYRELTDVELIEISLVTNPMQPLARVHAVENTPINNTGTQY